MRSADIQAASRHGKRLFRKLFRTARIAGWCAVLGGAPAVLAQVGTTFEVLEAGGVEYRAVKVLSLTPSTVTVRHSAGIIQLPMKALAPQVQERLGYDPDADAFQQLLLENERKRREAPATGAVSAPPRPRGGAARASVKNDDTPVGRALGRFGTAAPMAAVDLRPRFRELELGTKSQGLRPSCAVFAVVSALEYQNAAAAGQAEKLSEEYLIWATRRTLGIPTGEKRLLDADKGGGDGDNADADARDAGFSLQEVLAALRAYGIPLQREMPNTFGVGMEKIPDPGDEVVASARDRRRVSTFTVPGMNNAVKIANIMHALNEGVPVVVALRWPHWRTLRAPLLSQQTPREGYAHAVTLVGYESNNGQADGLRFIFKNSWGIRWGTGGYGFAEIGYLREHLLEAAVLEVR